MERTPGATKRKLRADVVRQNGAAIRELRVKDGLSQTQLAARAGIRQGSLSAIESEDANALATTLNLIAHALRVHVAAIMRDEYGEVDQIDGAA